MMYAIILAFGFTVLLSGVVGYLLGRYQSKMMDKIRTLEGQAREPKLEPTRPSVTGGAYQAPKSISTSIDAKQKAGIVETKTPERLDWENNNEIAKLEHGA